MKTARQIMIVAGICAMNVSLAQDTIRYTGDVLSNVDYHHGQLPLAMGVHNIQVMRANRDLKTAEYGFGWTYNHAPDMAYWNNTFYLEYLSNPVGEHIPPGQTLLVTSKDGYKWTAPVVIFPPYKVPDGFKKEGVATVAKNLEAVMHQRMGFYTASNKKLLALAYYGIALDAKDDPNDGNGIGRVVREINADGTFGPIYFIRYNHSFTEKNSDYPFYKKSKDKAFVAACDELLSKPLMMQHWNEEADRNDPLIPLKKDFKAFNYYRLPDNRVVGLWKHAVTSISADEGKTWQYNPTRAIRFVNSNAKIWGQRTSDGKFVTVYNPSEYRWPLGLSVSDDGLNFKNLLLVTGEIPPMRYGGNYKSYGPQYVRGMLENNGTPPDGKVWVGYSINKEDIWVASIPVPVRSAETNHVNETFSIMRDGAELNSWNTHSAVWAPVSIGKMADGKKALVLKDSDSFDYAKAERLLPSSKQITIEFGVVAAQNNQGVLHIEVQDAKGQPGMRLVLGADSLIMAKTGARFKKITAYAPGQLYNVRLELNTETRMYKVYVNGKPENGNLTLFFAPLASIDRIMFRTGEPRNFPTPETPADNFTDLPNAGKRDQESTFYITYLKTNSK
ncbi:MAG: exo-alpha-sialidase [Chitinophagaceae bacterium]